MNQHLIKNISKAIFNRINHKQTINFITKDTYYSPQDDDGTTNKFHYINTNFS